MFIIFGKGGVWRQQKPEFGNDVSNGLDEHVAPSHRQSSENKDDYYFLLPMFTKGKCDL